MLRILLLPLIFIFSQQSLANSAAEIDLANVDTSLVLDSYVEYWEDPQGDVTIDALQDQNWADSGVENLAFGYTNSVYWFRFLLSDGQAQHLPYFLEIGYPVLDDIRLYRRSIKNGQKSDWQLHHYGDKQPHSERPIPHRFFILPFTLEPEEQQEWVFRVETSSSMQFPLTVWHERSFFIEEMGQLFGMGIYYGIMLIMVLYNLFVFLSVREINYLYYVLYVASMTAFIGSLHGFNFQYLWPYATYWNDQSIVVSLAGIVIFGSLFTMNFLSLKNDMALLQRLFSVVAISAFSILIISNFSPYHLMIRSLIAVAIIAIFCALYGGVVRWIQGYPSARFYTIAWSSMLCGGVILALNKFDFIPRNSFTEYAIQIGSVLEVILLSFALADRLNQEKRVRFEAQLTAFEHEKIARVAQEDALTQERNARYAQEKALEHEREAREAQDRALEVQRRANETLESRVRQRTGELEKLNQRLEYLSTTDPLTALRNRRFFEDVIDRELARAVREREPLSILMLDIDRFKKINDSYGHQAGDDILRAVAQAIKHGVHRNTDFIARYGGEEFVLILPNTDTRGACHVAECLRGGVQQLNFDRIEVGVAVTVSIGIYGGVPDSGSRADDWVKFADDALYQSKENGRNQVTLYQSERSCGSHEV
ncbi:MAG: diguanylate cyclase [Saccharospirillaceae bacterium]|nr:hypothetical protein A3759_09370 [Thalassolituus sp. HI0120]MCH2039047.1 diguanylate cyclase [Saccharospirillaceae bacterium]